MSKFFPLHVISGYSFLKSGLTLEKIAKGVIENKYDGAAISDINVMYSYPKFVHLFSQINKKPVLGMDIDIDGLNVSLFIKNEFGYRNLIQVSNHIQQGDLSLDLLKELAIGLIAIIQSKSVFLRKVLVNDSTIDKKNLASLSSSFGDDCYIGIEVNSNEDIADAKLIREFAIEHSYKIVAFPKVRYLRKEDAIVIKLVEAIDEGSTLEEKSAIGYEYFMKEEEYSALYSEEEILNTTLIASSCNFELSQKRGEFIQYPVKNSDIYLKELAFKALSEKGLDKNKAYVDRLNYELSVISSLHYSDYFLLVQEYVNWAKTHDVLVGPGRGSAAGSLVAHLLNIIEIDPLKYNLLFERFLNVSRKTMPDIDVDFMDIKRDEVIKHLRDKYGQHNVANITAFQTIKAKQALRDIARIYKIPERHVSLLSKMLTKDDTTLGKAYKNNQKFKELIDSDQYFKDIVSLAGKIEGLPRQSGQHASGIIVNNSPMENCLPVIIDFNNNLISQYESVYLEEQGFLKMDLLGLKNLSTIDYCVDLINKNHKDAKIDKYKIPYDSPEIFSYISSGQVIGLFQIETIPMRRGINIIKPRCFDDIVALLALNRPGPMAFMKNYALRRDGLEKFDYISDDLKEILSPTYGIIIYQEQINQITIKMAGFDPNEADSFRRAISKKDKNIINSLKSSFINGSIKNGYSKEVANKVFEQIEMFAEYGFNKSHTIVYSVITCRMAYLKYHYPLEFYTALLQTGSDSGISECLSEMKKRGLKIYPPSINKSMDSFNLNEDGLIFPLSSISGIHGLFVENIVKERENGPFKDIFDFALRLFSRGVNNDSLTRLIDAGCFDEMHQSRNTLRNNVKNILQYAEINIVDIDKPVLGLSLLPKPHLSEFKDDPIENIEKENAVLGIMLSDNPLNHKKDVLVSKNVIPINEAKEKSDFITAGIIKNVKTIRTKKGDSMAFISIFDDTDEMELTIFNSLFEKLNIRLSKNKIVIIKGRRVFKNNEQSYVANDIEIMED